MYINIIHKFFEFTGAGAGAFIVHVYNWICKLNMFDRWYKCYTNCNLLHFACMSSITVVDCAKLSIKRDLYLRDYTKAHTHYYPNYNCHVEHNSKIYNLLVCIIIIQLIVGADMIHYVNTHCITLNLINTSMIVWSQPVIWHI